MDQSAYHHRNPATTSRCDVPTLPSASPAAPADKDRKDLCKATPSANTLSDRQPAHSSDDLHNWATHSPARSVDCIVPPLVLPAVPVHVHGVVNGASCGHVAEAEDHVAEPAVAMPDED